MEKISQFAPLTFLASSTTTSASCSPISANFDSASPFLTLNDFEFELACLPAECADDWDLASIESTLSPALVLESDMMELGEWLGLEEQGHNDLWMQQQQQEQEIQEQSFLWPYYTPFPDFLCENTLSSSPSQTSFGSTSHHSSKCCCSNSLNLMDNNQILFEEPLREQIVRNQQIVAKLSPLQKFQERLQRIERRLGQQQQRRKFSLKSGGVQRVGRNSGTKQRNRRCPGQSASNRISLQKWQEELKNVLGNQNGEGIDGIKISRK